MTTECAQCGCNLRADGKCASQPWHLSGTDKQSLALTLIVASGPRRVPGTACLWGCRWCLAHSTTNVVMMEHASDCPVEIAKAGLTK